MNALRARDGVLLGVTGAVWVMVVTFAGLRLAHLPFPPFDLFDWQARVLPGAVLELTVGTIISIVRVLGLGPTAAAAKVAEHGIAIAQFVVLGALLGTAVVLGARRSRATAMAAGIAAGLASAAFFILVRASLGLGASPVASVAWLAVVLVAWGTGMGAWARGVLREAHAVAPQGTSRRRLLYWTGLAGVVAGLGILGETIFRRHSVQAGPGREAAAPLPTTSGPAASPSGRALAARIEPAPGTRPEVTPRDTFYRIDIDSLPPSLDASGWRLQVGGLVRRPASLSLDDLRAMPSITQAVTLSCISNPVGGDLISTGFFTGVPLREVLARVEPHPGVTAVNIRAADDFHESVALETAMDERTLVVYALDGAPLPPEHGAPARIYIPDRYGMKQPKWITAIEVSDQALTGYWVERGWDQQALVRTTSVIDTKSAARSPEGTVAVGGIAYAGDRGIGRVEVSVDGGTWTTATLRVPPLSPLTWVQWRAELEIPPGDHTLAVRAWDGAGRLQVATPSDSFPAGATGIHERSLTVTA